MHSSSFDSDIRQKDGGEVLIAIAALVTEGRIPGKLNSKCKGFYEGPHCKLNKTNNDHKCDSTDNLCIKFENVRNQVLNLWSKAIPICVEVLLACSCEETCGEVGASENTENELLLEQWYISINHRRTSETAFLNILQLVNAIRSQLYFSQVTAWLTTQDENSSIKITNENLQYRLSLPGETITSSNFSLTASKHDFPSTDIGNGFTVNVSCLSLPRSSSIPNVLCSKCQTNQMNNKKEENKAKEIESVKPTTEMEMSNNGLLDDRMHTLCTLKGKHRCEDIEDYENAKKDMLYKFKRHCHPNTGKPDLYQTCQPSTSSPPNKNKTINDHEKGNCYSVKPYDVQNLTLNKCSVEKHSSEKRNCTLNLEQKSKNAKLDREAETLVEELIYCHNNDLTKAQLLLDAIERSGQKCINNGDLCDRKIKCDDKCVQKQERCKEKCERDNNISSRDMSESDIFSIKDKSKFSIFVDNHCDSPIPNVINKKIRDISNTHNSRFDLKKHKSTAIQKLTFEDDDTLENSEFVKPSDKLNSVSRKKENNMKIDVPSASEQAKFKKSLDSAASMVFHSQTGLPLTSSPAPVRRGKCFDFDSSITSVSAIKSALFSTSFSTDDESESEGSIVSPCSPDTYTLLKREITPIKFKRKGHAANLLGSFEESVLNGRLEPVSTVHGFTAELGASGAFVPKHLICPVTVFFYTLGDNDKVSSPYLGHINLGKKGYNVPKTGTVQVTLFNPLGTVVKMFVIMYDLADMPPNSQTFIRQRTLYMPTNCKDKNLEWGPKWLRYLIHLRFMSSKSGKIYLHSDIRMIIFRKCDMDTATALGIDMSYELRSFTHMPTNPRFSPRK